MPATDPIEILLNHDQWATQQLLATCATLSPGQMHRRFEMGPGSVHDTVQHILGAIRAWVDTLGQLRERRPRPETDGVERSVSDLKKLCDESYAELIAMAKAHPLHETVDRTRDGKTHTFTRAEVLTHVATHSMHHRAQCLNMLRQMGVSPLPLSSVTEWTQRAV